MLFFKVQSWKIQTKEENELIFKMFPIHTVARITLGVLETSV